MTKWLLILVWLSLPAAMAAEAPDAVTVFAAASLTDAVGDIAKAFEAAGHGKVTTVFAASSDLARQIERGAPADLFISADEFWADELKQRGLLDPSSRVDLLRNDLVLIAPAGATLPAVTIADHFPLAEALAGGRLAVGDPDHVPAGIYAKAALQALMVWPAVEAHLASAESVRGALAFVELGECPLGIVYLTDAVNDPKVRIVGRFPASSHPPIIYPAALVQGRATPVALAFMQFLRGAEARAIFRRFGFEAGS